MNLARLEAMGVQVVTGSLIYDRQTIGRLLPSGDPLLYPEGEEAVRRAEDAGAIPAEVPPAPARRKRERKVEDDDQEPFGASGV